MENKGRKSLASEITALEKVLSRRTGTQRKASRPKSAREAILADIRNVEKHLAGMYMDESSCGESFMDDEVDDEVILDDEVSFMDDDVIEEDVELGLDDDLEDDEDDEFLMASEDESGIEDEITQDYLSDVADEEDAESIATEPSMLDAAPTDYVAKLKSASSRLDKVAGYLEKQGRTKLAFKIDKIADAVDARIKKETRNA